MRKNLWQWLVLATVALLLLGLAAGCEDSSDDTDGDQVKTDGDKSDGDIQPDGDSGPDGDQIDGDAEVTDGDTESPDGDVEATDGDTESPDGDGEVCTTKGTISGLVITTKELAAFDRTVKVYSTNPFKDKNAVAIYEKKLAGQTATKKFRITEDGDLDAPAEQESAAEQEVVAEVEAEVEAEAEVVVEQEIETLDGDAPTEAENETVVTDGDTTPDLPVSEAYEFKNLNQGQYYVMLFVNINNDTDTDNDEVSVFPDPVAIVPCDPISQDRTNIDLYGGVQNPEWGSIEGELHVAEAFRDKRIVVVAAQQKPSGLEFWPSSADFLAGNAGSETRHFNLRNINQGDFWVAAIVDIPKEELEQGDQLIYISPYSPYSISIADGFTPPTIVTNAVFYVGMADPALGSVRGTITLPAAVADGAMGVYLFDYNNILQPRSWTYVKKTDTDTSFEYVVGNLTEVPSGEEGRFWVAGFFKIDNEHLTTQLWPTALEIKLSEAGKKDYADVNFNLAITELKGTVSLVSATAGDLANLKKARLFLAKSDGSNKLGGGVDVTLGDIVSDARSADYTIWPAQGGDWWTILAIDSNNDNKIDGNDLWCYDSTDVFTLDGTQRLASKNISIYRDKCQAPPTK